MTSLEGWSSTIELHPQGVALSEKAPEWRLSVRNAHRFRERAFPVGAVDEARTRDLHLGKVALYQLSYYRIRYKGGADEET